MSIPVDKINAEIFAAFNRYRLCNVQYGLFPTGNKRATFSNPSQSRSESAIVINPKNPNHMIGASKKFIDPAVYRFKLGVIYTFDAGNTWKESELPLKSGWDCMSDPALAFDNFGNAFLIGGPCKFNPAKAHTSEDLTGLGMAVYRSKNGGVNWENPVLLSTDPEDDKQWVVADNNPSSPFYGHIYVAWGASSPLRFARSTNNGDTWIGRGNEPAGSSLAPFSYAPELSVSPDGTLHILWHNNGSSEIQYLRSTDGGNSFGPVKTVVSNVQSLKGHLPEIDGWPHFDNGKFRAITLVTDCVASKKVLIVAWADMREGHSRIYYRRSLDNGVTWEGPSSGQSLLPNVSYGDIHCFHPQIIATQTGVIGCAFYTFGKEFQKYLIRVQLAGSWDNGATFSDFITVTEQSWDPLINAPFSHGNPNVHFIGEYFGLDAGEEEFALLWTETGTGVQELFSDVVNTKRVKCPRLPELVAEVLVGVTGDGGGLIIVGGKIIKVPPHSPLIRVLNILVAVEAVSDARREQLEEPRLDVLQSAMKLLEKEIEQIQGGKRKAAPRKAAPRKAAAKRRSRKST